MIIREALFHEHSNAQSLRIAQFIENDAQKFDTLIQMVLNEEDRLAQRAAHVMTKVLDRYPDLLIPYLSEMVRRLQEKKVPVALKRNFMRCLRIIDIPEEYEGHILDIGMNYLNDPKEAIAVKAHSMQVVFNLSRDYPELLNELKLIITEMLPHGSAGIRSRVRITLEDIKRRESKDKS